MVCAKRARVVSIKLAIALNTLKAVEEGLEVEGGTCPCCKPLHDRGPGRMYMGLHGVYVRTNEPSGLSIHEKPTFYANHAPEFSALTCTLHEGLES